MIGWLVWMFGVAQAEPGDDAYGDHLAQAILAQEDALLGQVYEVDPTQYRRLMRLKGHDRDAYVAGLYRAATMLDRMARDPALASRYQTMVQKQAQLVELARGYSALKSGEQAARRRQMEALAGEIFDLKQQERQARVAELTAKLQEVERELAERASRKEALIDEAVDRMIAGRGDE